MGTKRNGNYKRRESNLQFFLFEDENEMSGKLKF